MKSEIVVDGITYVPQVMLSKEVQDRLDCVIIRSKDSGCHCGYLKHKSGNMVTLVNSRRLWFWAGAATLSQLAMEGVKEPHNCKFPMEVDEIEIFGVCEIIKCSKAAKESIDQVSIWKQ